MTKERELLRRVLEALNDREAQLKELGWGCLAARALEEDIRTYLSTTSDDAEEPVGYAVKMIPRGLHFIGFVGEEETEEEIEDYGPDQIVPLYTRPKPEAETIETLKAENFKLASGHCTEGGPWGDEGGTPYCKYAERKPMTSEEMEKQYEIDKEYFGESVMRAFYNGIRFAEKHHGITDADV